jgi:hypothetical protein
MPDLIAEAEPGSPAATHSLEITRDLSCPGGSVTVTGEAVQWENNYRSETHVQYKLLGLTSGPEAGW